MKVNTVFLAVALLPGAVNASAAAADENLQNQPAATLTADARTLAGGNTRFALDMYAELRKTREGNLFFSPCSVSTALGMLYAGANDDTASQMQNVLHFEMDHERLHPAFRSLLSSLTARQEGGKITLSIANGLWGQKGQIFMPDFVQRVKKNYDAEFHTVDFAGATETARQTINAWVKKRTQGKIESLFERGALSPMTTLVLANAIYFKGSWEVPFDPDATGAAPFTLSTGKKVDVPMMAIEDQFGFFDTETFKAIELPCTGKELTMVIFLPNTADGLANLERALTPDQLISCFESLNRRQVNVSLPRFRISSTFQLDKPLESMGMKALFSAENASLSGIIDQHQQGGTSAWVPSVVHKAFIEVNEEGAEAAAATGIEMESRSSNIPPALFRADHPFLFMIRDRRSGSLLFIGRVTDPTG